MQRRCRQSGLRVVATALLLALASVAFAAVPSARAQQSPVVIAIQDGAFLPSDLTVPPGTTITWQNQQRAGHTTTSPGVWDSGPLAPGQRWSLVLAAEGTFEYVSALQPDTMRGRIVVQAIPAGGVGDGTRGTNPGLGGIGAVSPPPAGGATVGGVSTALAALAPLADAGLGGAATLLQTGAATTLVVTLDGLTPQAHYAGAIHGGSCEGPVLFPLEPAVGEPTGQGSATTTVNAAVDASAWWIEYHAAGATGPGSACGPVRAAGSAPIGPEGSRCPERDGVATERCN